MLIRILLFDKWFAMIAVLALYIGAAFLVLVGAINLLLYIIEYTRCSVMSVYDSSGTMRDAVIMSANLISIIDIYLLAIVFYLLAVGLYTLLIGPIDTFSWMKIENLDDLKEKVSKTIVLFLAGTFLRILTQSGDAIQILYVGISISVISATLVYYNKALKTNGNNKL